MRYDDYVEILAETFYCGNIIEVRPLPDQSFSTDMLIECSKQMRYDHPIGTVFRIKVKHKQPKDSSFKPHLYSSYRWSYEVIPKNENKQKPLEVTKKTTIVNNELPSLFQEGQSISVALNKYERNKSAREAAIKFHGTTCKVCSIDFGVKYGELGSGFIHVHHIVPLSSISKNYQINPEKDLIPVCPNCHAMLHKREPPFSAIELKKMISQK